MSECPQKRLQEHNAGKTKSTKGYRPWKLVYSQKCKDNKAARELEKHWKTGSEREKLKMLITAPVAQMDRAPVS